jgi:predicted outer membrane protein
MKKLKLPYLSIGLAAATAGISIGGALFMTNPASSADRKFVGKVSQDSLYQSEASKLALQQASSASVKGLAAAELKEHDRINTVLSKLAAHSEVPSSSTLNEDSWHRLETLKSSSPKDFDAAYLADMQQIQQQDEPLYADEAAHGTNNFKGFAAQADQLTRNDIGVMQTASVK